MLKHGFHMIPEFCIGAESDSSFFCPETGVALFDAVTDNFIESQGVPIPIDLIVLRAGERLRMQLLRLIS